MDYCAGGDLSNLIKLKRRLPEKTCKRFLQQLASALQYMRAHNITHMDLKPQNLLLSSKSNPVLKMAGAKLSLFIINMWNKNVIIFAVDFGFAQTLHASDHASSLRGSPLYMAPEILLTKSYDAKVDLWSVGVILYECLFGKAPYSSGSLDELLEKIKAHAPIEVFQFKICMHFSTTRFRWSQMQPGFRVSNSCQDLLAHLLQHDPSARIDFPEFFEHPFLDLQHAPGSSSLEKATQLATEAVKADQEQNPSKAIQFYNQSLMYLIPLADCIKNLMRHNFCINFFLSFQHN
jgi:serine/threonine-protein kinase ULK3